MQYKASANTNKTEQEIRAKLFYEIVFAKWLIAKHSYHDHNVIDEDFSKMPHSTHYLTVNARNGNRTGFATESSFSCLLPLMKTHSNKIQRSCGATHP